MFFSVSRFQGRNHSLRVTAANVLINRALPARTLKVAITSDQRRDIESHPNRTVDITRERFNQPATIHTARIVDFHEVANNLFAEMTIG